jgi:hypothetical protein
VDAGEERALVGVLEVVDGERRDDRAIPVAGERVAQVGAVSTPSPSSSRARSSIAGAPSRSVSSAPG